MGERWMRVGERWRNTLEESGRERNVQNMKVKITQSTSDLYR